MRSRFEFIVLEEKLPERSAKLPLPQRNVVLVQEVVSPVLPNEIGKIGVKKSIFMQAYSGIEFFDRQGQSMFKWELGLGRWEY